MVSATLRSVQFQQESFILALFYDALSTTLVM
jgi:hypothetical protein